VRFMTLTYRYPRGGTARWIWNVAAISKIQLVLQDQGYSRICIEEVGNGGIDVIMFADVDRAKDGFSDLAAALKNEERNGLFLLTGFDQPGSVLEVDSSQLEAIGERGSL
jgi:hypothetical protein